MRSCLSDVSTKECTDCGQEINQKAKICSNCGAVQDNSEKVSDKKESGGEESKEKKGSVSKEEDFLNTEGEDSPSNGGDHNLPAILEKREDDPAVVTSTKDMFQQGLEGSPDGFFGKVFFWLLYLPVALGMLAALYSIVYGLIGIGKFLKIVFRKLKS
jgi:hypothetical protein